MAFNKHKVMEAARKARDKGQRDKAIKEYLKIVREDPKDVRVWLKIGDLYAQKGAKPEATETYLKVAKFYSDQGFYLKAVAVYKQILKLDPRMVEVNLKLAELYRQLGLISDAMQHFEMVAAFFHREGKTKEALATIRQLVDLDPDNVATRIKLAELYSKEEMLEEASSEFQHACDFLRRNDREDDFIKVAERLLFHKPERVDLSRELAVLYLKRNDARRALQKLQVCFKADQRDVETLALLAQAFQALDQKGKTVSVLKELARVLTENSQRSQAQEVHRKILAYAPDDADSLAFLGHSAKAQVPVATPAARPRAERLASIADGARQPPPPGRNATGSMPIYDEAQVLHSEFSSPDNVDGDFAADLDEPSFGGNSSASAEVHADEIVKVLTETDVYVKYGLHQKAIHHLRRIFDMDPDNVEARDRLKEIFLDQGRRDEAVTELFKLAEITATADPDRAEGYLRELLELAPDHQEAISLARRCRLDVTTMLPSAPVEIVDDMSEAIEFDLGTGVSRASVDDVLEMDDLSFEGSDPHILAEPGYAESHAPETLDASAFADLELPTASSPSVQRAPSEFEFEAPPVSSRAASEFEYDVAEPEIAPDPTMEVSLDQVEEALSLDEDAEDLDFDSRRNPIADYNHGPVAVAAEAAQSFSQAGPEELTIDGLPSYAAPTADNYEAHHGADIPYPAEDLEAIEAQPELLDDDLLEEDMDSIRPEEMEPMGTVDGGTYRYESQSDAMGPEASALDAGPIDDLGELAGDFAAPQVQADPTQEVQVRDVLGDDGSGLEDELDEADFYVSQGLVDEARDLFKGLLARYPNHPLVTAKLAELDGSGGGVEPLFDGEDLGLDDIDLEPAAKPASTKPKPTVMLEKPIDDSDAATHFDLGQAYKEMGLFDEAIKEFQKVLGVASREVQCHLMIGLCHREQSKLSEAITQFKAGLYVAAINQAEKFGLYYEIGSSYEGLNDPQEALYYYEMLMRKDPDYRDVSERVKSIRSKGNFAPDERGTLDDETDRGLNALAAKD